MSSTDSRASRDPALSRLDLLITGGAGVPLGEADHDFFMHSWLRGREVRDRSDRLRLEPLTPGPAPTAFSFEVDCRYKRRMALDQPVELVDDTLSGRILYRSDPVDGDPDTSSVLVLIDPRHGFWHPNFSRRHGILCVGDLPAGAIPLDDLLQHVYSIITYQNRSTRDPADPVAAAWFASEPDALVGLEHVEPLFGSGGAE